MNKEQKSKEIQEDIKKFLEQGGKIEKIPAGITAEKEGTRLRPMREDFHKDV